MTNPDYLWWKDGVVYHIYLRSFADSDGDGLGDLPGLISRLDHLNGSQDSLGVDAIWVSPLPPPPKNPQGSLAPPARPAPRPALPQQLAVGLRRPGLGMGRGHAAVLLPHLPQATTRRQLAQPRSPPDDDGRRPHLARPRRGRLPARRLQRLVQRRRPARQPAAPRAPRIRASRTPLRHQPARNGGRPGGAARPARLLPGARRRGRALRTRRRAGQLLLRAPEASPRLQLRLHRLPLGACRFPARDPWLGIRARLGRLAVLRLEQPRYPSPCLSLRRTA